MKRLIIALMVVALASCAFALTANTEDIAPAASVISITPSDVTEYLPALMVVTVGVTGDIRVIGVGDQETWDCTDAPIHVEHTGLVRVRVWKVCATGTAATGILGYRKDPR